ncbi:hypothetical protein [Streptomyces sp. NPDC051909]|uniref:hypothetical protein n=1 Tax=Streptomyces sp. NPDC051909 TaxID=3154944 RepID=UPI0034126902
MGVFALFRRKSKDAAENVSVTEETQTEAAEETAEAGAEAPEPAAEVSDAASEDPAPMVKDGTVEIPKQQSAEEAADSGAAGEGARK